MINYPNGKKRNSQTIKIDGKHNTRRRGMKLEDDINDSNKYYLSREIAVIHKKPTPIQIVKVDYPKRQAARIVEAYFKTPSTTDYNGIYKGRYIDFEAKETKTKFFPLANISKHQIDHLNSIVKQNGIAFVIIAFISINEVYLVDAKFMIDQFYHGDKKRINYDEIVENGYLIKQGYTPRLDYLEIVNDIYLGGTSNE